MTWTTTNASLDEGPGHKKTQTLQSEQYEHIVTAFVPPHQKKGRQTCWSFLLILLTLVAMVELRKGLCCLLQPRHKDLYVIQGAVEDLLRETNPGVEHKEALRDNERNFM